MKQLRQFTNFIKERHAVYERKQAGKPKPWTKDEILQSYRFCNVYRELDTVTIWLRNNWRVPHAENPDLWFAMVVARLINWPESLEEGGFPLPWKPQPWINKLDARKTRGEKVFTGAYMIRGIEAEGATKVRYLAEQVLTPMWKQREAGRKMFHGDSLEDAHNWLMQFYGMGSFLAAQVICDVKYTPMLFGAKDWWSWAAPGPGSLRGMSRVEFGDLNTKYTDAEWKESLATLKHQVDPVIYKARMETLHAQDLQNCLCEFDKYERVRLGEGRPRSLYPGRKDV